MTKVRIIHDDGEVVRKVEFIDNADENRVNYALMNALLSISDNYKEAIRLVAEIANSLGNMAQDVGSEVLTER